MKTRHSASSALALLTLAAAPVLAAGRVDVVCLVLDGGYWQVAALDVKSGTTRTLSHTPVDKARLSFFPDGRLLVNRNDGSVSVLDPVSGSESVVPLEQTPVLDATVSPDGTRIAFSFNTAIDGNDLWIIEWPSRKVVRDLQMPGLQHEPTWSADGRALYFLSGGGGQFHDIWRYDLTSQSKEQLTTGELYHFDVAVAPNGDFAYSNNRDGNYELYLRHPNGRTERLTDDPGLDARPTFAPDGQSLLFESSRAGAMGIYRLDLQSKRVTPVTPASLGARQPLWRAAASAALDRRS
jgi:TolB protein